MLNWPGGSTYKERGWEEGSHAVFTLVCLKSLSRPRWGGESHLMAGTGWGPRQRTRVCRAGNWVQTRGSRGSAPGWNGKGASLRLLGPVQDAAPVSTGPAARRRPGSAFHEGPPAVRGDMMRGQRHPGHTGALGHRFLQGPQFLSAATLIASRVAPDASALRL